MEESEQGGLEGATLNPCFHNCEAKLVCHTHKKIRLRGFNIPGFSQHESHKFIDCFMFQGYLAILHLEPKGQGSLFYGLKFCGGYFLLLLNYVMLSGRLICMQMRIRYN